MDDANSPEVLTPEASAHLSELQQHGRKLFNPPENPGDGSFPDLVADLDIEKAIAKDADAEASSQLASMKQSLAVTAEKSVELGNEAREIAEENAKLESLDDRVNRTRDELYAKQLRGILSRLERQIEHLPHVFDRLTIVRETKSKIQEQRTIMGRLDELRQERARFEEDIRMKQRGYSLADLERRIQRLTQEEAELSTQMSAELRRLEEEVGFYAGVTEEKRDSLSSAIEVEMNELYKREQQHIFEELVAEQKEGVSDDVLHDAAEVMAHINMVYTYQNVNAVFDGTFEGDLEANLGFEPLQKLMSSIDSQGNRIQPDDMRSRWNSILHCVKETSPSFTDPTFQDKYFLEYCKHTLDSVHMTGGYGMQATQFALVADIPGVFHGTSYIEETSRLIGSKLHDTYNTLGKSYAASHLSEYWNRLSEDTQKHILALAPESEHLRDIHRAAVIRAVDSQSYYVIQDENNGISDQVTVAADGSVHVEVGLIDTLITKGLYDSAFALLDAAQHHQQPLIIPASDTETAGYEIIRSLIDSHRAIPDELRHFILAHRDRITVQSDAESVRYLLPASLLETVQDTQPLAMLLNMPEVSVEESEDAAGAVNVLQALLPYSDVYYGFPMDAETIKELSQMVSNTNGTSTVDFEFIKHCGALIAPEKRDRFMRDFVEGLRDKESSLHLSKEAIDRIVSDEASIEERYLLLDSFFRFSQKSVEPDEKQRMLYYFDIRKDDVSETGFSIHLTHIPDSLSDEALQRLLGEAEAGLLQSIDTGLSALERYKKDLLRAGIKTRTESSSWERSRVVIEDLLTMNAVRRLAETNTTNHIYTPAFLEGLPTDKKIDALQALCTGGLINTDELDGELKMIAELLKDAELQKLGRLLGRRMFSEDSGAHEKKGVTMQDGSLILNLNDVYANSSRFSYGESADLQTAYAIWKRRGDLHAQIAVNIEGGDHQAEFESLCSCYHALEAVVPEGKSLAALISVKDLSRLINDGLVHIDISAGVPEITISEESFWVVFRRYYNFGEALMNAQLGQNDSARYHISIPDFFSSGAYRDHSSYYLFPSAITEQFDTETLHTILAFDQGTPKVKTSYLTGFDQYGHRNNYDFRIAYAGVEFEDESMRPFLQCCAHIDRYAAQEESAGNKHGIFNKLLEHLNRMEVVDKIQPFLSLSVIPATGDQEEVITMDLDEGLLAFATEQIEDHYSRKFWIKLFMAAVNGQVDTDTLKVRATTDNAAIQRLASLFRAEGGQELEMSSYLYTLFFGERKTESSLDEILTQIDSYFIQNGTELQAKSSVIDAHLKEYKSYTVARSAYDYYRDRRLINMSNRETFSRDEDRFFHFLFDSTRETFGNDYVTIDEQGTHIDFERFKQEIRSHVLNKEGFTEWEFELQPDFYVKLLRENPDKIAKLKESGVQTNYERILRELSREGIKPEHIDAFRQIGLQEDSNVSLVPSVIARDMGFRKDEVAIIRDIFESLTQISQEQREAMLDFMLLAREQVKPEQHRHLLFLFTHAKELLLKRSLHEFTLTNLDKLSSLRLDKLEDYIAISERIEKTPSRELQRLKGTLLNQLLESDDPIAYYEKIEKIFIKNNLPEVGKIFSVFQILHPPDEIARKLKADSRVDTSPALNKASSRRRYDIIYKDLLRMHIRSDNRSLKDFLLIMQEGEQMLESFEMTDSSVEIPAAQHRQATRILDRLDTLFATSSLSKSSEISTSGLSVPQRILTLRQQLGVGEGQTLTSRVTEMFLSPLGYESIAQVLEEMSQSKQSAHLRNLEFARSYPGGRLQMNAGNLLKGVDNSYIENIIQNGSSSKEFLGGYYDKSDMTPFDTDMSRVPAEDARSGFKYAVENSLAQGYGDLIFGVRDRGQFQHSTEASVSVTDPRYELFASRFHGDKHYGVRTGFPSTEIDFMIAKESLVNNKAVMDKLFFTIVQNGFYIPVSDIEGTIIFTPEMYDEMRLDRSKIETIFGTEYSGEALIAELKKNPYLREFYEGDTGVWEGYKLDVHTEMVLNQFDKYFAQGFPDTIDKNLFRIILSFHDLGKPLAFQITKSTYLQHEYTRKIVPEVMAGLGYSQSEITVALAVVDQDYIGKYMQNKITAKEAAEGIAFKANLAGIPPAEFLDLLRMYYMSDASSYTPDAGTRDIKAKDSVLNNVFDFDNPGRIAFKEEYQQKYDALSTLVIHQQ